MNAITILLLSRTLSALPVNSYHVLRLIDLESATTMESIPGPVLVIHDLTQSKKNDLQPDMIFNAGCVHTNFENAKELELQGKENSILSTDLNLFKSFTKKKELGF